MPGFGPITNTRTLDDAIREVIARLSLVDSSPRARKLLVDARRYQGLMSTWENEQPSPEEQFEIIGNVLQLLGTAMRFVEQVGKKKKTPMPRRNRRALDSAPVIEIAGGGGLELELEPDEPFRGEPMLHRVVDVGDANLDPLDFAGGVRVARPNLDAWRATVSDGVRMKLVFEQADGTSHVLMRLESGAVLAGHRHHSCETIQIIDGCLAMNKEELSPGSYLSFDRGAVSPDLRSVGETTLLLIATDRQLL